MVRNFSSTAGEMALAVSISDSATSLTLDSVAGLPGVPFTLVVDAGAAGEEIVTVTGLAGTTATVVRGQDGSVAVQHTTGARILHMATGRDFQEPHDHVDSTADVHGVGVGASVVGTTTAQTLTGKTIDASVNTLTNIPTAAIADGAVTQAKLGGSIDADTINGRNVTASAGAPGSPNVGDIWIPL